MDPFSLCYCSAARGSWPSPLWLKKGFRKKIGVLKIWGLKTPKKGLKGVLKWKKGDLKSYIQ